MHHVSHHIRRWKISVPSVLPVVFAVTEGIQCSPSLDVRWISDELCPLYTNKSGNTFIQGPASETAVMYKVVEASDRQTA